MCGEGLDALLPALLRLPWARDDWCGARACGSGSGSGCADGPAATGRVACRHTQ